MLIADMLKSYPAIKSWADSLQVNPDVQAAISDVTQGKGTAAFKVRYLTVWLAVCVLVCILSVCESACVYG